MAKKRKSKKPIKKSVKRAKIKKIVKRRRFLSRQKPKVQTTKKALRPKKNLKKPKIKIKKKKVLKKNKKVVAKRQIIASEEFSVESLFRAKIKVIGIGGGGGSIVSEIGRSLQKATFVVADTDVRALKKRTGIKYFCFGQQFTRGLGTGVNVELAKQAAESAKEKISAYFKDQDIIIFIASLGGGLGSGATQIFAEAAKEFGGITVGIFTTPFKFEGKNKHRIALNALKLLRRSLNVTLVIPNEKIFKIIDTSTPITQAFSMVNKSLVESLESLIDLIYNPGIINIDFADLRTILRGRGNSAFLNTVEESGKNRVEKICEKILKNPLLQNSGFKSEKILFNIAGSENLSMFEVEKISSHIANLNPEAKIIFGISKNPKLKNRIKTTILMTGGEIASEIVKKQPVEKEKVQKPAKKVQFIKKQKDVKKAPLAFPNPNLSQASKLPVKEQKEPDVAQAPSLSGKKTIRRSGLEIKKEEELQEKKRAAQEKEWEIPAFLRKVKIKS